MEQRPRHLVCANTLVKIYVCGAGRIAAGVKQTIIEFLKEEENVDDAGANAMFDKIMNGRYATDIFE